MKFVIDSNIPFADRMFQDHGEVMRLPGNEITYDQVRDADVLIVRSVTPVNQELLSGSKVKFVGTATIGHDHIDTAYLRSCQIGFASAPGSNANSVAEYVIAALLVLASRFDLKLDGMTLGVVGVGHTGSRVIEKANALGMTILRNDPPLARSTGGKQFVSLDELVDADIITLHVPLTRTGSEATYHLFDERQINQIKPGAILINTSRGSVVETQALKEALRRKLLRAAVLDVWENEPGIDAELLTLAEIATPHIAGYSFDGKVVGALMMYNAVCKFFGLPKTWSVKSLLPPAKNSKIVIDSNDLPPQQILHSVISQCYSIEGDDLRIRSLLKLPPEARARLFTGLRANYPVRREFSATKISLVHTDKGLGEVFQRLGFQVEQFLPSPA